MYRKRKLFETMVVLFLLPLLFTACIGAAPHADDSGGKKSISDLTDAKKIEAPIELDILCVGDIMVHTPQFKAQQVAGEDRYDFTNNYKYVKPYIEKADFAMCNLETTFAGKPYYGYPIFAAPDELADAIKDTGFDLVSTANNHMNDRGGKGIIGTQNVLKGRGLPYTGSRMSQDEPRYCINEVKGVKIATISFTYETPTSSGIAINGIPVASEYENLINSFSYADLDAELEKMNEIVKEARSAGANMVIMFLHWGEEYQAEPNTYQVKMAEYLVKKAKVDIVFGSHPHVMQKLDFIDGVPVYYSLGNFISNQRIETLGDPMTEIGLMAEVKVSYSKQDGKVTVKEATAMPTWVERYINAGKLTYEIIPLDGDLQNNPTILKTGNLQRAKTALARALPYIGQ